MARSALLIIDLQNDYFNGGRFPLVGIAEAASNAARVLDFARQRQDLIVHVRHEAGEPDAPFFVPGTVGADFHPLLLPEGGESVVIKRAANAFQGTDLKVILDVNSIRDVAVVGAMSHICVDSTVRAASDYGFTATVIHDAVATRDLDFDGRSVAAADVHAAFMAALAFDFARVDSTEAFLARDTRN